MALTAATRLGPYEILGPIGAGGMGEVYKAKDTRLDRTVAINVLAPHLTDLEHRARFEREARTIAGLSHPHICSPYDVGEHGSSLFLVMEYLEGATLAERLRKGALPIAEAIEIGAQTAEALAAAHHAGFIHRDLKPGNIMLTKSGVKLLDFGLAKLQLRGTMMESVTMSALATREPATLAGTVLGTVPYMAPEQLEGKEADARSDIFSFGAVLYEILTGKRAFQGESSASVIAAILGNGRPSPLLQRSDIPGALDRLVVTCLAKDPTERWQSARDIALHLVAPLEATPASSAPRRPVATAASTSSRCGPRMGGALRSALRKASSCRRSSRSRQKEATRCPALRRGKCSIPRIVGAGRPAARVRQPAHGGGLRVGHPDSRS